MSFTINDHSFGEMRLEAVHGVPCAGGAWIRFSIRLDYLRRPPGTSATVLNAQGIWSVTPETGGQRTIVGHISGENFSTIENRDYADKRQFGMAGHASDAQITAIDRLRAGKGVRVDLDVTSLFHYTRERPAPSQSAKPHPETREGTLEIGHVSCSDTVGTTLNQTHWIDLLREIGHVDRILLEVPRVDLSHVPGAAKVMESFEQARKHRMVFNIHGVMQECRKVAEYARGHLQRPPHDSAGSPRSAPQKAKSTAKPKATVAPFMLYSKSERYWVVANSLFQLASPTVHGDDRSLAMKWTIEDADHALTMAAALLNAAHADRRG